MLRLFHNYYPVIIKQTKISRFKAFKNNFDTRLYKTNKTTLRTYKKFNVAVVF